MNLTELSELLAGATDVLRVETLDRYASASDGDMVAAYLRGDPQPDLETKQPWLDRLAAAAERGHPWRRLRVVNRPVSDYVRYACEWGYVDNVAAGEDVRVLDASDAPSIANELNFEGDLYSADDAIIAMHYSPGGEFRSADLLERVLWEFRHDDIDKGWSHAEMFTQWWARNSDLHRDALVS